MTKKTNRLRLQCFCSMRRLRSFWTGGVRLLWCWFALLSIFTVLRSRLRLSTWMVLYSDIISTIISFQIFYLFRLSNVKKKKKKKKTFCCLFISMINVYFFLSNWKLIFMFLFVSSHFECQKKKFVFCSFRWSMLLIFSI